MAFMNIQEYEKDMYPDVLALTKECGVGEFPNDIGGYGLVAMDEKPVGFVWALVSPYAAYIDYFCVKDGFRRQGLGLALMTKMIVDLKTLGIKKVYGAVTDMSVLTVARVYRQAGMEVKPSFCVVGSPEEIIEGMKGVERVNQ